MSTKRTVRQTFQHVADYPQAVDDDTLTMHTGELIVRTLFDVANKPDAQDRGSFTRANKARKMIMDRLSGRRRPGSKPSRKQAVQLTMKDLTGEASSGN